jgi:hypothetical protein
MISQALVLEFQQAIKEDYGRNVSLNEANEILSGLVDYFDTLAKIKHRIDNQKICGTLNSARLRE